MYAGYLQHTALPEDSSLVGDQNGQNSYVLAEHIPSVGRGIPRPQPTHHSDGPTRGLQMSLSLPIRRIHTNPREEHNNSMNPMTVGALALCPVGNGQGSFYILGRILNLLHATALLMPDEVIDKVHRMA